MPSWTPKTKPWQLQEAKAKFSQVFERALTEGPQYISRHNKEEVVVVRRSDYDQRNRRPHILEILLAAPRVPEFKIDQSPGTGRETPTFD